MRRCAGLWVLLISFDSLAQPPRQGRFAVTLAPFAGFVQAGIEYKAWKHFSWYNEFGVEYVALNVGAPDTAVLHPHGISARTELRYYVKSCRYVAFNVFLGNETHNTEVEYSHNGSALLTNDFGIRRKDWGCNFVYGCQWWAAGRFWVELYAGLGIRFGDIHTVGERFNQSSDYLIHPIDPSIAYLLQKRDVQVGYGVSPNLTANVRVLYRL
jgi:hypothetical protein